MPHRKILIVEDEFITALDLKIQIAQKGDYEFDVVATGEQAVKKAHQKKYDLVLMDIKLKGEMDGIEAAKKIKEKSKIRLIYVSGNLDLIDPEQIEHTKPDRILNKPISGCELKEIMDMIF